MGNQWGIMGRKLLKTMKTITSFRNHLAAPVGTRRGPPLVRGPQFENRCPKSRLAANDFDTRRRGYYPH